MTRTDTFVVGTLVVLFALVASLVGIPSLVPAASTHRSAERSAERQPRHARDEGHTAKASSATPPRSAR